MMQDAFNLFQNDFQVFRDASRLIDDVGFEVENFTIATETPDECHFWVIVDGVRSEHAMRRDGFNAENVAALIRRMQKGNKGMMDERGITGVLEDISKRLSSSNLLADMIADGFDASDAWQLVTDSRLRYVTRNDGMRIQWGKVGEKYVRYAAKNIPGAGILYPTQYYDAETYQRDS